MKKETQICKKCKTNTLDKCRCKEVRDNISRSCCSEVHLLMGKDCLCSCKCHFKESDKVNPEGVGEWEESYDDLTEVEHRSWQFMKDFINSILLQEKAKWEKGDKRPLPYIDVSEWKRIGQQNQFWDYFLEEEKAKWKGEIADKVRALDRHEVEEEGVIQDVLTLIDKL